MPNILENILCLACVVKEYSLLKESNILQEESEVYIYLKPVVFKKINVSTISDESSCRSSYLGQWLT